MASIERSALVTILARRGLLAHPGSPSNAELDAALRAFQQSRGLVADGIAGPQTVEALESGEWRLGDRPLRFVPDAMMSGDDVSDLQGRLLSLGFSTDRTDGVFGPQTEAALRRFQRSVGLPDNGILGPRSLEAFRQLSRSVEGGAPHLLHERESLRRSGPDLSQRVVVLDPGHGGADPGAVSTNGTAEAGIVDTLARLIESRLRSYGTVVHRTRGAGQSGGSDFDRARFANDRRADVLISLHCDHSASAGASGVATFFYGMPHYGAWSAVGEELAGLIQREIVARTGLTDCRTHPRSWAILQRSAMPAVRVEIGYLSHPDDAAYLSTTEHLATVADAIVVALQRVYLGEDDMSATGVLDVAELRRHLMAQSGR